MGRRVCGYPSRGFFVRHGRAGVCDRDDDSACDEQEGDERDERALDGAIDFERHFGISLVVILYPKIISMSTDGKRFCGALYEMGTMMYETFFTLAPR